MLIVPFHDARKSYGRFEVGTRPRIVRRTFERHEIKKKKMSSDNNFIRYLVLDITESNKINYQHERPIYPLSRSKRLSGYTPSK